MARTSTTNEDQYSEQETARRRDTVIKRMLNTPPKPHSEMKVGKHKAKSSKSPTTRKRK
jgi:hypothetical protein